MERPVLLAQGLNLGNAQYSWLCRIQALSCLFAQRQEIVYSCKPAVQPIRVWPYARPCNREKTLDLEKIVSKGQFNLILKFKCSKKCFFQNSKMRFFSCHKCRRREKESIAFIHTQFNIPPLLPRPRVCFALHHFLVSSKREGNKEDGFYKRGALCNSSLKSKVFYKFGYTSETHAASKSHFLFLLE